MMMVNSIKPQPENLTEEKARIIAHLKGDGCIYRCVKRKTNYTIYLERNDIDALRQFENDVLLTYGIRCKWKKVESGKRISKYNWRVYFNSVLAYNDLQKYGKYYSSEWDVPESIMSASDNIKVHFISTFFDDEGTVIVKEKDVKIYSTNINGLIQLQMLLREFSVTSAISSGYGMGRNVYAIHIRGENISKFYNIIGFLSKKNKEKFETILGV